MSRMVISLLFISLVGLLFVLNAGCSSDDDPVTPPIVSTGFIFIDAKPDSINAPWHLSGPASYLASGTSDMVLDDLAFGSYTLTWGAVFGFRTPSGDTLVLAGRDTMTFHGNYGETGTIVINQTPDSLVGAGWSLMGPQNGPGSGNVTLSEMPIGPYELVWDLVDGQVTPPSDSQVLAAGDTMTFSGTYEIATGTIVINQTPDSLVGSGWSLTGPQNETGSGGVILPDMPVGPYELVWDTVDGHITPPGNLQALAEGDTVTFSGTYEEEPTGTIVINQTPDSLVGAGWLLTGPQNETGSGGVNLPDMPVGQYVLFWETVDGHITPPGDLQALAEGDTMTFSGTYEEGTGTIVINQTPDTLVGAGWSLTGQQDETGLGDVTLTEMPSGQYSITWYSVAGLLSPCHSSLNLVADGTVTFNGVYAEVPAQVYVLIPPVAVSMPASFIMGSTAESDETPHQVTLTGRVNMASTEVTNAQYVVALQWAYNKGHVTATTSSVRDALDTSTKYLLDLDSEFSQINFSGGVFSTSNPDRPVVEVSWYGAAAYCDWMSLQEDLPRAYDHSSWSCNNGNPYTASGYRLPTEAEWEFACRAGTTTQFNTGNCIDAGTESNFQGRFPFTDCPPGPYLGHTTDPGSYPANQWGLFDIHGNVWEWCNELYGEYNGDETDPVGVKFGHTRVLRGGSWFASANSCRSAIRWYNSMSYRYPLIGFRTVRSAP